MSNPHSSQRTEKRRQSEALRKLQKEFGFESQQEMAHAMQVSAPTLSRAMNPQHPAPISRAVRSAVAQFLGRQCKSERALQDTLDRTGWRMLDRDWELALEHANLENALHGVPRQRTERFVGRNEEIAALRSRLLSRRQSLSHAIVVHGIPGVGKTRLVQQALEETEVLEHFKQGIFWLRMEDGDEHRAIAELCGEALAGQPSEAMNPWRSATAALRGKRVLIVLDGADDWLDLNRWAEVVPNGTLLVTTRRADLGEPEQLLRVEPMDDQESRALLVRDLNAVDIGEADLDWITEAVGGLPLALYIINRIAHWERGFTRLIDQLRRELLTSLNIVEKREQSVRVAFDLSYERLDENAKALFRFLSGFPQPFELEPVACVLDWKVETVGQAFLSLLRLGLADAEQPGRYRMHNLLHLYASARSQLLDTALWPQWEERFAAHYLEVTRQAWQAYQGGDYRASIQTWQHNLAHINQGCDYAAHLRRADWVFEYFRTTGTYLAISYAEATLDRWRGYIEQLVHDVGHRAQADLWAADYLFTIKRPNEALCLASRARAVFHQAGNDRDWILATLCMAQALLVLGRAREARPLLFGRDLSERAAALPPDDALWPLIWQRRGSIEHVVGNKDLASYHYWYALEALAEAPSADPTLQAYLGMILGESLLSRDPWGALEFLERAMGLARQGPARHLWVAIALDRVTALTRTGRVDSAASALSEVEAEAEKDPRCALALHAARAEVAWSKGRFEEAESEYAAAAAASAGSFNEPEVWIVLGLKWRERNEGAKAIAAWEKAQECARRIADDHSCAKATFLLGEWLWKNDRSAEARPLLEEVVRMESEGGDCFMVGTAYEMMGMQEQAELWRSRGLSAREMFQTPDRYIARLPATYMELSICTDKGWVHMASISPDEHFWKRLAARLLPDVPEENEERAEDE